MQTETFGKIDKGLIKKHLNFQMDKVAVLFDTSQALFSSVGIDRGTQALLNSLRKNNAINYNKVLDLGCGYGAIGLFLKSKYPSSDVTLSDRDALAAAFSCHNAKLNNLTVRTVAALDYPEPLECYSLILTNFPAKLEKQGIKSFIFGASKRLISGGVFAIVVVTELTDDFEAVLTELNADNEKILVQYKQLKNGYSIYHLSFTEEIEGEIEHKRSSLLLPNGFKMETVRGLPEFDSLSFGTLAALEIINEMPEQQSVCVVNPGQGHLALMAADKLKTKSITAVGRDLLSLTVCNENLDRFSVAINIAPYLTEVPSEDLVIFNVAGKNDSYLSELNLRQLKNRANVLLFGESLILERFERSLKLKSKKRVELNSYLAILI